MLLKVKKSTATPKAIVPGKSTLSGAKAENIRAYLSVADGVIVGSSLKENGYTWNPVDPKRVASFMSEVVKARG